MKIVWIGAGNLATQLGEALHRAGHETLQVFSRTMASALMPWCRVRMCISSP